MLFRRLSAFTDHLGMKLKQHGLADNRRYWVAVLVVAVSSLALGVFLETGRFFWVLISALAHAEMIYIAVVYLQKDREEG